MDGKDNKKEGVFNENKHIGSGFENEDNLRQRLTKQTETQKNYTNASDIVHETNNQSKRHVAKPKNNVSGYNLVPHSTLPKWLQDNEFHINMNRPPLPSFVECFKSVFKLHTETGNIWTHLVGCVAFIFVMIYFLSVTPFVFEEKLILSAFFVGAILCLGFSTLFHTVMCHSEFVCTLFRKLDYCGISCLIMGSMLPWVYYAFYCNYVPKLIYISMIVILGTITLIFSLLDRFGTPEYRAVRALSFVIFGLSAVIPAVHYMYIMDWDEEINISLLQSTFLLAFFYIFGAFLYAIRMPEKLFPGKCDLWIQSHQIFHVLVLAGAYVTYKGLKELSIHRHMFTKCGDVNINNDVILETVANTI